MKNVALVIAHTGYQAIEYGITKEVLSKHGFKVITVSDKAGTATAHDSSTTPIDVTLDNLDVTNIDALFLIGGSGALACLDTRKTYALLQEVAALSKPYGSICISSRILAKAGVLGGKRATGWDGDGKLNELFSTHAVIYVKKPVVVDGSIVTAVDPHAAQEFGTTIVKILS